MKKFTVKCNKCGSEDIFYSVDYDHTVTLMCNNCDNQADEYELDEESGELNSG